jgi:hypothetical protein
VASGGARVIVAANRSSVNSAMHHKWAVIDDQTVLVGACNWTYTAFTYSNEDVLTLRDPAVAQRFDAAFGALVRRYDPAGFQASDYGIHQAEGTTQFVVHMPHTVVGEDVIVTGSDPALGSWDPSQGVVLRASGVFPTWTGTARFPAGSHVAYKAVVRRLDGTYDWELGADRVLDTDPDGTDGVVDLAFRDEVDVTFRATATLPAGAQLRLAGAEGALGGWDPAHAKPLSPDPQQAGAFSAKLTLKGREVTPVHLIVVLSDGTVNWADGWDYTVQVHDQDAPQTVDLGAFR